MFFKKSKKTENIELNEPSLERKLSEEFSAIENDINQQIELENNSAQEIEQKELKTEEFVIEQKEENETINNIVADEEDTITEEDEEISEEENNRKIYILGDNALACFLAMKFQKSGEKVVIITQKEKASKLKNNGVTIIENHSLQKKLYKFETSFWLKETPKILIITSNAINLNASLTAISRKKIVNSPVILFTPIKDTLYIKNILENDIYHSFFDGYLLQQPDLITLFGRNPSISFALKDKIKNNQIIISTFKKAGIDVKIEKNDEQAFWEYFSVYSICSLVSAAYNKNIFDVIKDKEKREKLIPLIFEVSNLAKFDGVELNKDEILKRIYNTPLSYPYPLQVEISKGKAGDFNLISTNLTNISRTYKCKTDELDNLLKKIYNIIMA